MIAECSFITNVMVGWAIVRGLFILVLLGLLKGVGFLFCEWILVCWGDYSLLVVDIRWFKCR